MCQLVIGSAQGKGHVPILYWVTREGLTEEVPLNRDQRKTQPCGCRGGGIAHKERTTNASALSAWRVQEEQEASMAGTE